MIFLNKHFLDDGRVVMGRERANSMSHLRGCVSVLEIAFVGQCEAFVCLDFVNFHIFFSLGREARRSVNGLSIL